MRTGQKLLQRRGARIAVGIAALGALAVVAVVVGLGIYIFGGKGAASTHGTVTTATLVTDNDLRNRTLQGRILETGDTANKYATFTATSLKGMPSTVAVGQTIHFQVLGNLTIHGVTRSATFDVTLTAQSATALKGQATTTVRYKDFNITIPPVPSVSDVAETTTLALTFTAQAGG